MATFPLSASPEISSRSRPGGCDCFVLDCERRRIRNPGGVRARLRRGVARARAPTGRPTLIFRRNYYHPATKAKLVDQGGAADRGAREMRYDTLGRFEKEMLRNAPTSRRSIL